MKLFAFPFAGGSSLYFYRWKKQLDACIDFVPVELAGRGSRLRAPFYRTFAEAVEDAYEQMGGAADEGDYAFFGHSMGSLLSYELSCLLRDRGRREPSVLFLSGRWAPHITRPDLVNLNSSEEELKARLLELGGATPELFENPVLADTFIPILKSDFYLMESYAFDGSRAPLSAAIHAMTGVKDTDVNQRDLGEWRRYTRGEFSLHKFKGGHFYINDSFESVIGHINRVLGEKSGMRWEHG